jgi:hypothetical protein
VVATLGSPAGFGAPRRLSPLPPAPPYGHSLGPKLSATSVRAAAGGHGTVVVAWQRVGRIEARISRDRGRSYGPVRYLGPSSEPFPSLNVRVSAAGKVLVVWGARPAQGPARVLVSRAAIAAPGAPFTTRVLERSAPLDLSTPQATDLVVAPTGAGALAWSTVDRFGTASPGFVAISSAGGPFGATQELPAAGGAYGIRLAYEPQGLLAAWNARDHLANAVVAAELR